MLRRGGTCVAAAAVAVLGAGSASAQFKQIGYMPSWSGSVSSVQYQYLTHINYAFALPNSNGSLQAIDNASKLSSLVSTAHGRGVKVLLSIGGWNGGNDSAFETLAASSTGRTNFTNACVNVLNQYSLDGIDIDWEYPDPGTSGTNYQNLMNQLCSAMHSRGKLCTAAVVAQGTTGGGVTSTVFGYVDYLQIMAYDANNGNHSSYSYADSSLSYWLNRGLPKAKAVLGVPFYARPSWASYATLLAAGCSSTSDTCNYQGTTNYYNGTVTIGNKRTLAMNRGGGIMNWELSQDVNDSRSLLRAMAGGSGTGPTPTPQPTATPGPGPTATPQPTATPGGPTPTPCSGCTFSGYYRLTPRHSGKAVVVQSASTANSANVFQWTYGGTATNDEWQLLSIGSGYHRIINRNSGRDMVVQSASTAEGANIFQYAYGGATTNDEWAIVSVGSGYYRITNRNSGKSAEVAGGGIADGTNVDQRTYSGATYQQFQLTQVP